MGFREYFTSHADLADELYDAGHRLVCHITATAAIDALAEIWFHDFPQDALALAREFGGNVPAAVRMSRFVRRFSGDVRAERVAIVRLAEDARPVATGDASAELDALLAARTPRDRSLPPAYLDLTLSELAAAAPTFMANRRAAALAEEYTYPGLLYTLYRCPTVHTFSWPKKAQGFAKDEEVFYMPLHAGFTSFGVGHKLITNWLRASLNGFLAQCEAAGIEPAKDIDPGADQELRLRGKWEKAFAAPPTAV